MSKKKRTFFLSMVIVLFAGAVLFFLVAATGLFSDERTGKQTTGLSSGEKQEGKQNALGGQGAVRTFPGTDIFGDDTTLYYCRQIRRNDGKLADMLYAYQLETGEETPLCRRELCNHDTPDCSLYCLFDSGSSHASSITCMPMDCFLYYTKTISKEDDKATGKVSRQAQLLRWNIETNKTEKVGEFLINKYVEDEEGLKTEIVYGGPYIGRVNPDTIWLLLDKIYLYDNQFTQKASIDAHTAHLACSEDYLVWRNDKGELDAYCISTGQTWQNLIETAFRQQGHKCTSVFFFVRGCRVYCAADGNLVTFEIGGGMAEVLAEGISPGGISMLDDCIYYGRGGRVYCIDTTTGEERQMEQMRYVPHGKLEDGTLFGLDDTHDSWIVLYDADGKEVVP